MEEYNPTMAKSLSRVGMRGVQSVVLLIGFLSSDADIPSTGNAEIIEWGCQAQRPFQALSQSTLILQYSMSSLLWPVPPLVLCRTKNCC